MASAFIQNAPIASVLIRHDSTGCRQNPCAMRLVDGGFFSSKPGSNCFFEPPLRAQSSVVGRSTASGKTEPFWSAFECVILRLRQS